MEKRKEITKEKEKCRRILLLWRILGAQKTDKKECGKFMFGLPVL